MRQKLIMFTAFFLALSFSGLSQEVEVKDHYFYIDGQKFFIKGLGFEVNALPGQLPWEKTFNPEQLHFVHL